MAHLDGKGPINEGLQTGRGLGLCKQTIDNNELEKLGKGMGLRRKSGGGKGLGKRLKSGLK